MVQQADADSVAMRSECLLQEVLRRIMKLSKAVKAEPSNAM